MSDLREIERASIRAFVQSAADEGYLSGRVLDFGCGQSPYMEVITAAGGDYWGYDSYDYPGNVPAAQGSVYYEPWNPLSGEEEYWQAILCTQVIQYLPIYPYYDENSVQSVLSGFCAGLEPGKGHLVMTYPTNWPEVEPEDLHRFTKAGMERLLKQAGFEIIRHDLRHQIVCGRVAPMTAGYGVIARA